MTIAGAALGVARTASYLAVALVLGGLCFVAFVSEPALRLLRGAGAEGEASSALARRANALAVAGCGLGAAGAAGILAAGDRPPGSASWLVVELSTWIALGVLLWVRAKAGTRWPAGLAAGCACATLALVLAGEPSSVLIGFLSWAHVLAAGVWVGGIVYLLAALPVALRRLDERRRAGLLLGALTRFSPLALIAAAAIVLTGALHTCLVLPRPGDLFATAFGRLILLKLALVAVLVGLGALNRYRVIPTLQGLSKQRCEPGRAGRVAWRSLAAEAVAMVAVLIATSALVAVAPSSGPSRPHPHGHLDSRRSALAGAGGSRLTGAALH